MRSLNVSSLMLEDQQELAVQETDSLVLARVPILQDDKDRKFVGAALEWCGMVDNNVVRAGESWGVLSAIKNRSRISSLWSHFNGFQPFVSASDYRTMLRLWKRELAARHLHRVFSSGVAPRRHRNSKNR
jgi:hypothetical protein